jgi:hypothetical protein
MNMLSAMLWAWVGVSVVSLAAAALVVLAEVRAQDRESELPMEHHAGCARESDPR